MQLDEFVKTTLCNIVNGIKTAQQSGIYVCPKGGKAYGGGSHIDMNGETYKLSEIAFEIGPTNANGEESVGGIGVFLGSIGLGTNGKSENKEVAVTNIKFSLPVVFPQIEVSNKDLKISNT